MRSALWGALFCALAARAAAQDRPITIDEPPPVTITGFAVGSASYDRAARDNSFAAGKIGLSLFKPVGDAYLFGQLTTALDGAGTSTAIDNLLFSWTPHQADRWTVAFGKFDAPIGFERDDEPLNLIATNSFTFAYARPGKLTGAEIHYTASPRFDVTAAAANGWDRDVDNNRGKTGLLRAQLAPVPWVTIGLTGVYGPERDSTSAHQRSLASLDLTLERGRLIVGAELNAGRERNPGAALTWRGGAVTAFARLSKTLGVTGRYDQLEDPDGLRTGTPQILRSVSVGPMWYFSSAQEGIFSNIEHTTFHLPQIALRGALRFDRSSQPFFPDAAGGLSRTDTKVTLEVVYVF
ncbi:MAG TPA: outer membrane beta-barrel protein [Gemmatimonadales bacterium]